MTDKESEVFPIRKGTTQGDPLSSLLFNTVLQYSLETNLTTWQENKEGIRLSDKTEGLPDQPETRRRCASILHIVGETT